MSEASMFRRVGTVSSGVGSVPGQQSVASAVQQSSPAASVTSVSSPSASMSKSVGAVSAGGKFSSYVAGDGSTYEVKPLTGGASMTRSKIGLGHWKNELKSAGGSQTVLSAPEMLKGDKVKPIKILNHKGEVGECTGKMGKTQRRMAVGA
jgi:hypothetical protein